MQRLLYCLLYCGMVLSALLIAPLAFSEEPADPPAFKHAGVIAAWDAYRGKLSFGKGQTLALLDDGCKLSMPEWSMSDGDVPKVLVSYDSVDGDDDPKHEGRGYHGSTIGIPSSVNYKGKLGVAFNNQVAVVRALECCHCKVADSRTLAAGLQWVIDHHAKHRITAINLAPVDDLEHAEPVATEIDEKLKRLRELGIWVSAPAGNHNFTKGISWPACQPNCFAIGAVRPGKDEVHLDRHAKIDLVVPAAATSSSNAIVCGAVLLLREAIQKSGYDWKQDGPNLPEAMLAIFQKTGPAVEDPATRHTFRRLDVKAALDEVFANGKASLPAENGLVGHWKLRDDARDSSGLGHHGENQDVKFPLGEFNGTGSHVQIPDAPALRFGVKDFSISLLVHTDKELTDVLGDLVTKFDPARRQGFTLNLSASNGGYNSTGNARHVQFGIDAGTSGQWTDCGRPGGKSHSSDALTVFNGSLYAGNSDASHVDDWAHVYRYLGEQNWEDCGRVGTGRTRGVYALVVHDGALYAATSASHGRQPKTMDFGRVYRYRGDKQWEDIGAPGEHYRVNGLASFRGKLYTCAFNIGDPSGYIYVYDGGTNWRVSGEFAGYPHAITVHDGKLYTAYPKGEVFEFDGESWKTLGNPYGRTTECSQIHSLGVYQGELHAGTWPKGKVAVWRNGKWIDRGQLGDATEVIALTAYNGCFYAGTIPRAEVFRFEADHRWTSIRRLFDHSGFEPVPVGSNDHQGVIDWSRATSLAVFGGKLFASTGTCYRTMIDPPRPDETRGSVYAFSAGVNVSHDTDLGPGLKHLTAVRDQRHLKLYVDGRLTDSAEISDQSLDVSNNAPLRLGAGPQSFFSGKMQDVRLYNRALAASEIDSLFRELKNPPQRTDDR